MSKYMHEANIQPSAKKKSPNPDMAKMEMKVADGKPLKPRAGMDLVKDKIGALKLKKS